MEIDMFELKTNNIEELKEISKNIRKDIIEMVYAAQSGHPRRLFINNRYINRIIF